MYRKIAPLAGFSIVVATALWMWRLCDHDSRVSFLPRTAPAEWIVYPKPVLPYRQAVAELPAEFRREFAVQKAPASVKLSVRACRRFVVSLNGKQVPISNSMSDWKRPQSIEAAPYL